MSALRSPILKTQSMFSYSSITKIFGGNGQDLNVDPAIRNSPVVTKELSLQGSFDAIEQSGCFDIEWSPADKPSLTLCAQEHVLPMMDVFVRNGTLVVRSKPGNLVSTERIRVIATSPSVKLAKISGAGDIELAGVTSPSLAVHIQGSGDILVSGQVRDLSVDIVGSGDFEGMALAAQNARLNIAGSGDIRVKVSQDVEAQVRGSGDILVQGCAGKRNTRVMGAGEIRFI